MPVMASCRARGTAPSSLHVRAHGLAPAIAGIPTHAVSVRPGRGGAAPAVVWLLRDVRSRVASCGRCVVDELLLHVKARTEAECVGKPVKSAVRPSQAGRLPVL